MSPPPGEPAPTLAPPLAPRPGSTAQPAPRPPEVADSARRGWMAVLARSPAAAIAQRLAGLPPLPGHTRLRGPETGLAMVRGRQGGDGAPFNLGEMTVTRCTVRLADGTLGHAYVAGRDARQAELAALLDAALQLPGLHALLMAEVIAPLAEAEAARRAAIARKAAATKVAFSTMAIMRGA